MDPDDVAKPRRGRRGQQNDSRVFDAVVGAIATGLLVSLPTLGVLQSWPAVLVVGLSGCAVGGVLGGLGRMNVLWEIFGWSGRQPRR